MPIDPDYEIQPRTGPTARDHTIVVRVDQPLHDFIRSEALREYTSMSGLLASLAAELRRCRRREGLFYEIHDQEVA